VLYARLALVHHQVLVAVLAVETRHGDSLS
jgi:hypothetical protein